MVVKKEIVVKKNMVINMVWLDDTVIKLQFIKYFIKFYEFKIFFKIKFKGKL